MGIKTYRDNYPCGRKFCGRCKKWRPVSDFTVRKWADEPFCTAPITLTSYCVYCAAEKKRIKSGAKPRVWYAHGSTASAKYREHRNRKNRESSRKRRESQSYRDWVNEYQRIWYNAKAAEARRRDAA